MRQIWVAIVLACISTGVQAQSHAIDVFNDEAQRNDNVVADDGAPMERTQQERWRFVVGGGAIAFPRFQGSDDIRLGVAPIFQASYGRFFAGLGGVGFDLVRERPWRVNVRLSGSRGRRESDADELRGLGDVDSTLRAGITARYASGHVVASAQLLGDVLGRGQGVVLRADVQARFMPVPRLFVSVGPGITVANGRYAQTYFGIDALQHANSGLPQYTAEGGLNSIRFGATAVYFFDRHWLGLASASLSRLQQDAADSPIVKSRSQPSALISAAYAF